MEPQKDILGRLWVIYLLVCLFGLVILGRAFSIGVVQRAYWLDKKEHQSMQFHTITPARGNLYSADGSQLAISVPEYTVRMDMKVEGVRKVFNKEVDSLALGLSRLFNDKSYTEYKRELKQAYAQGERYYPIKRKIRFKQLKEMRKLPILRRGKNKGGMIEQSKNVRERPFNELGLSTLGRYQDDAGPLKGIEKAYDEDLKGVGGKRLMQKISGGVWKPVNDENEIEPKEGNDIVTTLDVGIQDVAQAELLRQLKKHNAEYGCVVLMEVKTGYVRAIVNLGRTADSSYGERFNYAIEQRSEPGSTFKLASLMALFEDGLSQPSHIYDTKGGKIHYGGGRYMRDSHEGGYEKVTLAKAFEVSLNTAISEAVRQAYGRQPEKFVERLKKFHLHERTGIRLPGEVNPSFQPPNDALWPWMSIGYRVALTPLQMLCFYNAVANNGTMVQPQLVQEIRYRGQTVRKFDPVVIDPAICSKETIGKVKPLLEGVVERGTATNLHNRYCRIAGKTGTAQIAQGKDGYNKGSSKYQTSFVGYFPAEDPKYSCIVVVGAPSNSVYYANLVAGPVFREVADKVYAQDIEMQGRANPGGEVASTVPAAKSGNATDLVLVLKSFGIQPSGATGTEWVKAAGLDEKIIVSPLRITAGQVPDVTGMGLKDALFLLENRGLRVKVQGRGTVRRQSVKPGTAVQKDVEILIELA